MDALVADGAVSYAQAFAQNPVCTPSRCSFMTGWYPHAHGHRSMKNMLKPHEPNLLSVLKREGYCVWWGGKNDLVAVRAPEDYLRYCDTKCTPPPSRGEQALEGIDPGDPRWNVFYRGLRRGGGVDWPHLDRDGGWVREAIQFIADAPATTPFCLFLPLLNPHPPYVVEEVFHDAIVPDRLPPPWPVPERDLPALDELRRIYGVERLGEGAWRDLRRVYYAMCAKVDDLFGRVVGALKRRGFYDDTIIVFLSDHGDFAGDYALPEKTHLSLQDSLLHVPLVIKPAAASGAAAGVRRQLVELVDLCPTLYELLDIAPGYDTQGKSLGRSLCGDESALRECVHAEVGARPGEPSFTNSDVAALPETDFYQLQSRACRPAHRRGSYAVACRTTALKYVRRAYTGHHELYDLARDPGELHNLSGRPEMAQAESRMAMHLLEHFMQTGDVLPHAVDSRAT